MKFKIETPRITFMLSKVSHGVGKKYTLPITEYLQLKLNDGILSVRSTNGVNFVTVSDTGIEGDNGECVVKADTFIKLVEKTTKPEMSFKLSESHLEVKGNGTHKLQIISETFPSYEFNTEVAPAVDVNADVLRRVFKINESAIARELIVPHLTGYNLGESCITTDGVKMCINETKIVDVRVLVTQQLADLISKVFSSADTVVVQKEDNKLLMTAGNIIIFGTELEGLAEYPDVTPLLQYEHESVVKVSKGELLSVIDRLSLFVDDFENNGIRLKFSTENIEIEDLKSNSQETIEYVDGSKASESVILLNIDYLKNILSVVSTDIVEIRYDPQLPVRVNDDHVTFFLGTMNA